MTAAAEVLDYTRDLLRRQVAAARAADDADWWRRPGLLPELQRLKDGRPQEFDQLLAEMPRGWAEEIARRLDGRSAEAGSLEAAGELVSDALATAREARKWEIVFERGILQSWALLEAGEPARFAASLAQLPPGEARVLRQSLARLRAESKKAKAADETTAADEPRELDLAALGETEPQPPAFIVPDWLPAGEVTLLAAHGGTGKSATALYLAVCLATGRDFYGMPVERRAVDFLSFEDSEPVIHWRLFRICHALGVDFASLAGSLRVFDGTRSLSAWFSRGEFGGYGPTMAFHSMAERIAGPGRVAIVDGASDTFAGSEIDRGQVKAFVRMLRSLVAEDGAVLLLAHVDKNGAKAPAEAQGYSGSTGWHNGVRCRWFMFHEADEDGTESDRVAVEVRKSNYGSTGHRMVLRFDPATHVFRRVDDAPEAGRPLQRVDEAEAIVRAIRDAWAAGDPIPAATAGTRTAHSVCAARDGFPDSLKGRGGQRRFKAALEQLRAAGAVRVVPFKRANRHLAEVLHAPE